MVQLHYYHQLQPCQIALYPHQIALTHHLYDQSLLTVVHQLIRLHLSLVALHLVVIVTHTTHTTAPVAVASNMIIAPVAVAAVFPRAAPDRQEVAVAAVANR
jgi:hypothetical protein